MGLGLKLRYYILSGWLLLWSKSLFANGLFLPRAAFRSYVWLTFVESVGEYKTRTFFRFFTDEDWEHLYLKTQTFYRDLLSDDWYSNGSVEGKEDAFRSSIKGAIVESWAWTELKKEMNSFCANCKSVDDYTLMQLNGNKNPRPDGLFYEIVDDRLVINYLFESKSGSRRANLPQALRYMDFLLENGLRVPEGYFPTVYLRNEREELIPLRQKHINLFSDSYFVWVRDRITAGFHPHDQSSLMRAGAMAYERLTSGFSGVESRLAFTEYLVDKDMSRIAGKLASRSRFFQVRATGVLGEIRSYKCVDFIYSLLNLVPVQPLKPPFVSR